LNKHLIFYKFIKFVVIEFFKTTIIMKKLGKIILVFAVLLYVNSALAQDKNNQWQFAFGNNAVDFHPVGTDSQDNPTGLLFSEYFNIQENWNTQTAINTLSISRYGNESFSYGLRGSLNTITRLGDQRARISGKRIASLDAIVTYNLPEFMSFCSMEPFLEGGTGYTWFGNQRSTTMNAGYGVNFQVSEKFSVKINSAYKHAFNDMQDLKSHFQHNIGVAVNFGGKDTDRDGIYDQYDDCPDQPGLPAFNGCPDNDGDGIINSKDSCPDVAGLVEFDGCPDTDGDGIPDTEDRCVNEPGSVEMGGCPDTDGDGVANIEDGCVDVAGPIENNGCPWPDSDGDTVLDKDDKCPNVAGLVNNAGCPQPSEEIMEKLNAVGAQIPFELNQAILGAKVKGLLDLVATIMTKYSQTSFIIEGHTDTSGPKAFNQKLSENRANAVKDYLSNAGINSDRMSTVGFGEEKPSVSNNTRKGRITNRRVEFKVVD
jgi:OOP family OmpA-OmpF porin